MAIKTFCDGCQKIIDDNSESYSIRKYGKGWFIGYYCPKCFIKNWQLPSPSEKEKQKVVKGQ